MTRTILVAGTASHVGKSTVAAGLCRLLADRGISVAPFKAQNMSNNARAVPRAPETIDFAGDDADITASDNADTTADAYGEIGVSQYVQARAAHISPTTDCNPVLLKPRGEGESQLVVDGVAVGHYAVGDYYDDHWETAREAAVAAHDRLAADHDVIVAEGAARSPRSTSTTAISPTSRPPVLPTRHRSRRRHRARRRLRVARRDTPAHAG